MSVRILEGNAPDVLRTLPAEHFHMCVTSPPYWALRRYGTEPQVWGGEPDCLHVWGDELRQSVRGAEAGATAQAGNTKARVCPTVRQQGAFCQSCGAWRGELGSEPTPELFIAHLVSLFDEVYRVLRKDGTLWVNLADTYSHDVKYGGKTGGKHVEALHGDEGPGRGRTHSGLGHKNLCLIPWRFAIAMQERGWYVRSTIAWTKPAPMPESVTDRPTNAWEPIFLFTKSPRYFYDADAVRVSWADDRNGASGARSLPYSNGSGRHDTLGAEGRQVLGVPPLSSGRNLWSYWSVAPEPSREEHFASYPSALVRTPIKAGTSEKGCCAVCGAPWRRVTERTPNPSKAANVGLDMTGGAAKTGNPQTSAGLHRNGGNAQGPAPVTLGWEPSCRCNADVIPCRVLDPFGGSGTTGIVADQLGRDCTLIELKPEYAAMSERRVKGDAPLFAEVERVK